MYYIISFDFSELLLLYNIPARITPHSPDITLPIIIGTIKLLSKAIVKARCPPKVKAADTAKAEFRTMPFLSILFITPKVDTLVTIVPRKDTVEVSLIFNFEPNNDIGFLRILDKTNIRGKAPERVTQALAQMKAASSKVPKLEFTVIFVRNVKIESASPTMAIALIINPNTEKHLMQKFGKNIKRSTRTSQKSKNANLRCNGKCYPRTKKRII